ncbi:flavodoxin-like fold family protein [Cryptosporidium muris RN66]|uniref:Flavodoxin-like fold family protein n=1 Tax=Cryptosporidium muris (strain RN66) TaxID=441375 RepID=B6AFD0_CRYMR|nr:flavodoxin-like fold family protein [Cryptosporidium muris RN66]EEA06921.1 flavodoxin-like fold family protein [Cryptosporidium muris RN66]|eukprot:XP_002141270.1 flavodoxin-like fold family protein [Cryptosporidium muris RN66]
MTRNGVTGPDGAHILVILSHPGKSIANQAIIDTLVEKFGQNIQVRHLNQLYPDQKIDIEAEQRALISAELVILQFPMYWYNMPPSLKNWLDLVLSYGFAYGTSYKLEDKLLLVSITTGGEDKKYEKNTVNDYLMSLESTSEFIKMKFAGILAVHSMLLVPGLVGEESDIRKRASNHAKQVVIPKIESLLSR